MQRQRVAAFKMGAVALDALVLALTWWAVLQGRLWLGDVWSFDLIPSGGNVLGTVEARRQEWMVWLVVPVWLAALHFAGTYRNLRRVRGDTLLLRIVRGVGMAFVGLLTLLFILQVSSTASRLLILGFSVSSIGTVFVGRSVMLHALHRVFGGFARQSILVVGTPDNARPLIDTLLAHGEWGVQVEGIVQPVGPAGPGVGGVPVLGVLEDLHALIEARAVNHVYVVGREWDGERLRKVAETCEEVGVQFSMDANFLGLSTSTVALADLDGWTSLTFSSTPTNADALVAKRVLDILLSGLALVVLSPLMLAVALCIKLADGGPVLFVQERSGLYGRTFRMLKFRSMIVDAEDRWDEVQAGNEMTGPVFKMKRDPRITRIGAFIRKTSIDELPQLWNVIAGEMSIVGPRPPIPAEVARYERWQMRRLSMKPGLTCIWQVSGRNEIDFETWMKLDLQYIDNWTLLLDLKLIARTIPVVLLGYGAR